MSTQDQTPVHSFASLHWYDETIKFIFNFVAKTSELLLAAGVVVSSANFLTEGGIMQDNTPLAVAWAWAQALAIDSSLGIVFVNGFQSVRERDKLKAIIYFTLTVMLATVAGLLTHFDALAHATGLPVTSPAISGIIPLWLLTGLRAIAVIGFLLVSRLKNVSFSQPQEESQPQEPALQPAPIDYNQLAAALATMMQQVKVENITSNSKEATLLPLLQLVSAISQEPIPPASSKTIRERKQEGEEEADERLARAYTEIKAEREQSGDIKPVSARELASRARIRRSTCGTWLETRGKMQEQEEEIQEGKESLEETYTN